MNSADPSAGAIAWKNSRVIAVHSPTNRLVPILSLIIADLLSALCTLGVLRLLLGPSLSALPWLLASFIGFSLSLCIFGLYPGRGMFGPERVRLRAFIALLAFLPPAIVCAVWLPGRGHAVLECVLALVGIFCFSTFFETAAISILLGRNLWHSDAVIIGDDAAAKRVRLDLALFPEIGLRALDQHMPKAERDTVVLEARSEDSVIGEYLVDTSAPLPTFHSVARIPSHFACGEKKLAPVVAKRLIDLTGASVLLLLASPLMLGAALLILILDGRPIFFRQYRGGLNGKWIGVWKFRSMYRDAPGRLESVLAADPAARAEWDRFFKLRNDPRILPVIGNAIRRTSVDELPQLWNVLRGEMSLIGPRPFPENHLAVFSQEFLKVRHSVQPGLSGLWQVTLRSDGDLEMQERLDTAYVRGWSIWLDWYILLRTPIVLLSNRGAR